MPESEHRPPKKSGSFVESVRSSGYYIVFFMAQLAFVYDLDLTAMAVLKWKTTTI